MGSELWVLLVEPERVSFGHEVDLGFTSLVDVGEVLGIRAEHHLSAVLEVELG